MKQLQGVVLRLSRDQTPAGVCAGSRAWLNGALPTANVLVVSNVQHPHRTHELNRRMQLAYDGIAEIYAAIRFS